MCNLDAECKVIERAWRASDAMKTDEFEQLIYRKSTDFRVVATSKHLGEETSGLTGQKRLCSLRKRVDSFKDRVELAITATMHLEHAKDIHTMTR
jgi:hypothetical protein